MTMERFEAIRPALEKIGVRMTPEQACEVEMIFKGGDKPFFLVEEGHVYYDMEKDRDLFMTLFAYLEQAKPEDVAQMSGTILALATHVIAIAEDSDGLFGDFSKSVQKHIAEMKRKRDQIMRVFHLGTGKNGAS